jgi:hypothetical protein
MNLGNVVLQIRASNTSFGNRVMGAAEWALAVENTLLEECAFVLPVGEVASKNSCDSGIVQLLTERFAVVVALKNDTDKKDKLGFDASNRLHAIRNELFIALLGWPMPGAESLVSYSGGRVADVDRAWLWYQFEFEADTRLQALYDPNAGALPEFREVLAQWKVGGDSVLPLPSTEHLPTNLMQDPVLTEIIHFDHEYSDAFGKGFKTLGNF